MIIVFACGLAGKIAGLFLFVEQLFNFYLQVLKYFNTIAELFPQFFRKISRKGKIKENFRQPCKNDLKWIY